MICRRGMKKIYLILYEEKEVRFIAKRWALKR